jgi:hypothetical protein
MSDDLPNGISGILEYLARTARGHDNHLKSNEVAKLKADLMNVRSRWLGVSVSEIADRCQVLGMGDGDVATVTDLVRRTQRPPLPVSDEMTMSATSSSLSALL